MSKTRTTCCLSKEEGKCQQLPEEQQVAMDIQGVSPPGGTSLMDESQIGKALRPQTPECGLLLVCLHMFAVAVFLWYLVRREWVR